MMSIAARVTTAMIIIPAPSPAGTARTAAPREASSQAPEDAAHRPADRRSDAAQKAVDAEEREKCVDRRDDAPREGARERLRAITAARDE